MAGATAWLRPQPDSDEIVTPRRLSTKDFAANIKNCVNWRRMNAPAVRPDSELCMYTVE
jgi:hypothetical protein